MNLTDTLVALIEAAQNDKVVSVTVYIPGVGVSELYGGGSVLPTQAADNIVGISETLGMVNLNPTFTLESF